MIATLIGKEQIYKIELPQIASGDYWINDTKGKKERKLINIKAKQGTWYIKSSEICQIIDKEYVDFKTDEIKIEQEEIIEETTLQENGTYIIRINTSKEKEIYILYCAPKFQQEYNHYDIHNLSKITIGSGKNNSITYNNAFTKYLHATIILEDNKWILKNIDKKIGTIVNNELVKDTKELKNGDIISIMGLKIVILGYSIFVNKPIDKVELDTNYLILNEPQYQIDNIDDEEIENITQYSESEYFSRAPRINNVIEREKVKIDPPPQMPSKEDMPAILTLGTTITMGLMMVISMMSSITGMTNGTASIRDTAFSLSMSFIMLIGMVLFPILINKYQKNRKKKYEKERNIKYIKYINSRIMLINEIIEKQTTILYNNYLSSEECEKLILSRSFRLWERKIEDYDFLTVRLGHGDMLLDIDLQYPEESFSMDDDNLVEILNRVAKQAKKLTDVPITLSLAEKNISAIIAKDRKETDRYFKNLLMQLIAFHSYNELKLVFLTKEDKKWDYVKMLPHIWNNTKQVRFFADNYDDMRELSRYLEEEYQQRMEYIEKNVDYKNFDTYYLIITDDYKKVENLKIITDVLKAKKNMGFGLMCIDEDITKLPNECQTFININKNVGVVFDNKVSVTAEKLGHRQFIYSIPEKLRFEDVCRNISNIPIRVKGTSIQNLPDNYTFLEMYDVGKIEQLNIQERWRRNDSTQSLKAPIGIDSSGSPIILDIHEKYHGPHGLIAGTTGSGKSEFIITYILSLAINYNPDDITFLLIDYKGGGLAGAFAKNDIYLPHLVGTITNIETNGLQRSLDSIQSELRRRQVVFNKARETTNESTIDIYKYQKLYHDGLVDEPIPHLLIICDEFAELKQQQPDFMDELISVSRIGRSLGVHLILATQKPAGVVNDQMRSNSKFGICLKVQSKGDSTDIIERPDAANLKKAGQFYIQVGNNEYFALGQSGWSGVPYIPAETTKKKIDTSIEFVSNIGETIKKVDNQVQETGKSQGDQLSSIVKYLFEIGKEENIHPKQLWLDAIPENIYIDEIRKKYEINDEINEISPVIGEYDDPYNQRQGVVNLNLSGDGNTIIYGNAESGKESLLSTIIYDTMTTHTADEAQFYIMDFGSEALKTFKNSPNVGDVVFVNDQEKVNRLFEMLQKEIKERKKILSEYNGDYNLYLNTNEKPMPMIIIIINNFEAFTENYENTMEDTLQMVTREGTKCGITFIITASNYNSVRYRLSQNFKQCLALQLNNEEDYSNILDGAKKKRPSHIFGRGLVNLVDGNVYEFQTARICEPTNWNVFIKEKIEQLNKNSITFAKPIPVIPDKVTMEDVKDSLKGVTKIPIGITKKTIKVLAYDFTKNFLNIVSSKNLEDAVEFITHIIEEIRMLEGVKLEIIDAERIIQNTRIDLLQNQKQTENNNYTIKIIIGLDKLIADIGESNVVDIVNNANELGNYSFIIVDSVTRFKNHEYDEWFKKYKTADTGIWVGNGVNDQYLMNISTRNIVNNCGKSYGYTIKDGEATLVKLLGMKEKGDENE